MNDGNNKIFWFQSEKVPALHFAINQFGVRPKVSNTAWKSGAEGYADLASEREKIELQETKLYFTEEGALNLDKWLKIFERRSAECEALERIMKGITKQKDIELGEEPEPISLKYNLVSDHRFTGRGMEKKEGSEHYEVIPISGNILFPSDIMKLYEAWENGIGVSGIFGGAFKKSDGRPCPIPRLEEAYDYIKRKKVFKEKCGYESVCSAQDRAVNLEFEASICLGLAPATSLQNYAKKMEAASKFCAVDQGDYEMQPYILKQLSRDAAALAYAHAIKDAVERSGETLTNVIAA